MPSGINNFHKLSLEVDSDILMVVCEYKKYNLNRNILGNLV